MRVLLPALGLPMMLTKPARWLVSGVRACAAGMAAESCSRSSRFMLGGHGYSAIWRKGRDFCGVGQSKPIFQKLSDDRQPLCG